MRCLLIAVVLLVSSVVPAQAQAPDPGHQAHWGVAFDFVPLWRAAEKFKMVFDDPQSMNVSGSEFRIGLAHGSDLGGGLEFVYTRKNIKDGSTVDRGISQSCFGSFGCYQNSTAIVARGAYLDGFEVNKYISLATIRRRVQIGLTVGGGIGVIKGGADRVTTGMVPVLNANNLLIGVKPGQTVSQRGANEMIIEKVKYLPLINTEFTAGFLVAPGLKVKAGGGLNFPGTSKFTLGLVYLFGAH